MAAPSERDEEPAPTLQSFTDEPHRKADWLGVCDIHTVAMESSDVHWLPLSGILLDPDIAAVVANPRDVKPAARIF